MFIPHANAMSPDLAGMNSMTTGSFNGVARLMFRDGLGRLIRVKADVRPALRDDTVNRGRDADGRAPWSDLYAGSREAGGSWDTGLLYSLDALVQGERPQPVRRAHDSGLDGRRPEQCEPLCAGQPGRCTDRCRPSRCWWRDSRRGDTTNASAGVRSRRRLLLLLALRGGCGDRASNRRRHGKEPQAAVDTLGSAHLRFASLPPSAILAPVVRG